MLIFASIIAVLLLLGILYQQWGAFADRRRLPPPGRLVRVHGSHLHIRTAGSGQPAVIFESGVAASSVNWTPVQKAVSEWSATASYDRAGFAWSAPSKDACTPGRMIESLRLLLRDSGFSPPYVLVGHSFGAFLVRLYAARWPEETAGLVLVDPALLMEWAKPDEQRLRMLNRGVALSRRGALLARLGFVRLSLAMLAGGARVAPKFLSRLSSGQGGQSVLERIVGEVRKMPPELWPAIQSHWCRPASFESMAQHLRVLPDAAALVYETNPIPGIPVTVISSGRLTPEQHAEHRAIADASEQGRHIIAEKSGHWVQLDQPEIVIAAIRDLIRP